MNKILLTVLILCMLTSTVSAQERTVSGKVTDVADGTGLPGVNVVVEGTTKGTTTDADGKYTVSLGPGENALIFSFVGYKPQTVQVADRTVVDVLLGADVTALEEIVVVGYGTQQKRDVTGSITSLKNEDIADKPNANPLNSIQGRAAGVIITNSGAAGVAPAIRIRGVGSIANTDPLYIVDGIFTNNIDFVNPNDVASMEILKDPSSLAMFGVQGANGVIIITTKRAKKDQTNISLNSYYGFQKVQRTIDVVNGEQFQMLYNEQLRHLDKDPYDFSDYTANTDWQDIILRTAPISNNSLSISHASEKNQVIFSLNYLHQDGVVKYDSYRRFTVHVRDELQLNKNLKIGADLNVFRFDKDPYQGGILANALWAAPVYDPRDADGNWNSSPDFQRAQVSNPLAFVEIYKNKTISYGYRFVSSAFAELNFLKNFTWKSVLYTDLGFNSTRRYDPLFEIGVGDQRAQYNDVTKISQSQDNFTTWQMDHTLTYATTLNEDHEITLLAGITQQYKKDEALSGYRQSASPLNIPDDPNFWYLGISTDIDHMDAQGGGNETAFRSFLFRANYSFKNRYLLNASFRRDGTTNFSPTHKWGNFPSIGAGWVLSEEDFFPEFDDINFLKLKASWGRLGNDKIGNYLYYPLLNTTVAGVFGDHVYPAAVPSYLPNPDIHWEVVEGYDLGIEGIALSDRLNFEFDYYHRETNDILVNLPLPASAGADFAKINAGNILNSGIELTLGWSDKIGDIGYNISGNITTIHNEVKSLPSELDFGIVDGPARTSVGHPIGAFYGYVQEGIFQTEEEVEAWGQSGAKPGDIKFKDLDDNGVIDDKDRTYIGSPTPDFTFGGSLGLTYRGFEFSLDVQGVAGNEIYKERQTATFAILNYEANRLGRWTGPGTSDKEPIMDNTRGNNYKISSYFIDKGDYFRIRNVNLGYNFPSSLLNRARIKSAKIYVNAQNLATFTKATGYSPEVGGSPLRFGVDVNSYPVPSTYTIGLNLNF